MATHPQPPLPPGGSCYCPNCRSRGLMGPAVLITLGILFMLSEFDVANFGRTWPILLIVIGLVKVLASSASKEGHVDVSEPTEAPPQQGAEPGKVDHV
ncbi:MAG: LiaI-LiaF-like domain-containing protein [Terriglobales bacterium]